MFKFITITILAIISQLLFAQEAQLPWTVQSFRGADNQLYFASIFRLPKGQSIYWINPGNSGVPLQVNFSRGDHSIKLDEMAWGKPTRHVLAKDLHTYTLAGEVILFHQVPGLTQDEIYDQDLSIEASWLTCSDICLQGAGKIKAHFIHDELTLDQSPPFRVESEKLIRELEQRAKMEDWPIQFDVMLGADQSGKAFLFYSTDQQYHERLKYENLLYPYPQKGLLFQQEALFQDRSKSIYGFFPIEGEITFPYEITAYLNLDSRGFLAKKVFTQFSPDLITKVDNLKKVLRKIEPTLTPLTTKEDEDHSSSTDSFPYFLLMAFLGGLILNVMPCVLPVISLKLFGLIKINGSSHREIFIHNLLYTFGILFTFSLLALTVLIFKSTGEVIGWGFQMQSPAFLFIMITALVIFALNMFGLFEFRTPGGRVLGQVDVRDRLWGSFLSGILAVILSTPCSAPFLGTALTFAFTTSSLNLFALLMMIGFGLAFPILLTGIFPKTIAFLPKPGNWMNHLKKFLGLSLALTALWLITIFDTLTSNPYYQGALWQLLIILAIIVVFFIVRKIPNKLKYLSWPLVLVILIASIDLLRLENVRFPNIEKDSEKWDSWSEQALREQLGKRKVFVKLYADWCITCKVDHKLIIESDDFKALVKQYDLKILVGDYTAPRPELDKWMQERKMVGVPAYLIQLKSGEQIKIEGQLTIDKIRKILSKESL